MLAHGYNRRAENRCFACIKLSLATSIPGLTCPGHRSSARDAGVPRSARAAEGAGPCRSVQGA